MSQFLLVLLVLACPLMMMLMMRGGHGHGGHGHAHAGHGDGPAAGDESAPIDELKRRRAELDREIDRREAS